MKRILLCLLFALCVLGDTPVSAKPPLVRIAILRDANHFTLTIDGGYDVSDANSGERLATGIRLGPSLVAVKGGAIEIGEDFYERQRLIIEPRKEALVS